MTEPQVQPLIGYPKAWSPGTAGLVAAEVVLAPIASEADFARYRGKLQGRIVLTQPARAVAMLEGPIVWRMSESDLERAKQLPIPPAPRAQAPAPPGPPLAERIQQFFKAEGVVATFDRGPDAFMVGAAAESPEVPAQRTDGGTIFVSRLARHDEDAAAYVPSVTLAVEHYNRMVRVLEKGLSVKVQLDIETAFHDEGPMDGFNVVAELPGTDLAHEVVMIGAHLDSQQGATGATDNASGCAAMMEAMRLLKAVNARPRRTIRLALWGGEEVGFLGSRHYVRQHFGDPDTMVLKPEHGNLAAYFNLDNGSGRIRGVWSQGNMAVTRIFTEWMSPLQDLGMSTVAPRSPTATDHLAFNEVGLPGFQFIQDRLEYNSRTHHSNMDTVDRVQREDLVQMSTVAAVFAYNAAMRDEKLPRKAPPEPRKPKS
jgi:hypothetical protein